ncbi:MAG: pyridoxamine 5'-phosphate oxidase family protein [Nocardioidaceae bacterium]|nr:pyridoxamine 5'-phosphate oxidase family protein [Nocardioidaceae bacterium]
MKRGREDAVSERARLQEFLSDGLVAHVGVVANASPVVIPCAYAFDHKGPDKGGTLYVHGSVAAVWLTSAIQAPVCVTVTELDGLVAARSAFNHSMNYRSAVVIGVARLVSDPTEIHHALDLLADHMIAGRSQTLRPSTRKELAATAVLAVPMFEASMKARAGGPVDETVDVELGTWGGHIPLTRIALPIVEAPDARRPVPVEVVRRADALTLKPSDD